MINHEHRCIFVHIPKTAGNSINRVFGIGWEDHKDLQRYRAEVPRETFESYFKFAVVRNPWDRLFSDYNYQVKKSRARASKLFVFAADGSRRNFAEWVETALGAPDRYDAGTWGGAVSPHIHRWSPQLDWLQVDGKLRIDFVARLERLAEDFRSVCQRVGLPPVRLPHRNRRLHWHYSRYYDRTTRECVAAYYARDIEEFGYEFEHAFLRLAFNWPGARSVAPTDAERETDRRDDASPLPESPASSRAARSVSFATARPPTARRFWRRPGIAAAAGFAVLLGLFGVSTAATTASPETNVLPASVHRMIMRSAAPAGERAGDSFFARAHRLRRTMAELKLSIDLLPAITPGGIVTFSAPGEIGPGDLAPPAAPFVSRSGSGPVPRWWLRRNRDHQDD